MNRFSNTNSPGLLKLNWQFLAVFIIFTGLAGCGGSAGSGATEATGPTGPTENAAILAVLDKSTDSAAQAILPAGADTFSMATFWEAQVLKGFTKVGALRGYAYQNYPNITSLSSLETNASDTTKTR
jgi:hypothetical protein